MRSRNLLLRSLLAAGLILSLTGCSNGWFADKKTDLKPRLPPKTSLMDPEPLQPVPKAEPPKVTAFKARAHVSRLNGKLVGSGEWYDSIRQSYNAK